MRRKVNIRRHFGYRRADYGCVLFCEGCMTFVFLSCRKVIFLEVFSIATKELSINEEISAKEVRVIDENGEQIGVVATSAALAKAYEKGLDLVEISPNSAPPVCRIMKSDRSHVVL